MASCRWVRPILTMSCQAWALAFRPSRRFRTAGIRVQTTPMAAAIYMAEGKVSLEDWDMLTSSLGWTGFLLPKAGRRAGCSGWRSLR